MKDISYHTLASISESDVDGYDCCESRRAAIKDLKGNVHQLEAKIAALESALATARADALLEAAKVCENAGTMYYNGRTASLFDIAARFRSLASKPEVKP